MYLQRPIRLISTDENSRPSGAITGTILPPELARINGKFARRENQRALDDDGNTYRENKITYSLFDVAYVKFGAQKLFYGTQFEIIYFTGAS